MGQIAGTSFGIGSPLGYTNPFAPWASSPYIGQGFGLQHVLQALQSVPQQLQQIQAQQQQQTLYLQQLLHVVPAQLQQLQQLLQVTPYGSPFAGALGAGIVSPLAGQGISHVM